MHDLKNTRNVRKFGNPSNTKKQTKNLNHFGCKNDLETTNQISQHFSQFVKSHFVNFLICGLKSICKITWVLKRRFPIVIWKNICDDTITKFEWTDAVVIACFKFFYFSFNYLLLHVSAVKLLPNEASAECSCCVGGRANPAHGQNRC